MGAAPAWLRDEVEERLGGRLAEAVTSRVGAHPALPWRPGELRRVLEMVATALAGFLVGSARLPPPPGLPTVRTFQLGQGVVALDWLRRRTGWP